jgi:hypothetical protein
MPEVLLRDFRESDFEDVVEMDGKNKRSLALVVKLGFAIEGERFNEELQKNEILFSLQKPKPG